jgi:hypothetical protein
MNVAAVGATVSTFKVGASLLSGRTGVVRRVCRGKNFDYSSYATEGHLCGDCKTQEFDGLISNSENTASFSRCTPPTACH